MPPSVAGTPAVTHHTGSNTLAPVANMPSGVTTGEYILACIHARNQSGSEPTNAAFTSSGAEAGGSGVGRVWAQYHKVEDAGSEPSTYTFTSSVTTRWSIVLVRIAGADLTTFLDGAVTELYDATSDTTINFGAKTPTDATRLVFYFGAQGAAGTVSSWGGLSNSFEGNAETSTNARTVVGATGSGATDTVTLTSTQASAALVLSINPISGVSETLLPDAVLAQSGYSNATTGNIANLHGDPDVSGGTGFTAS